VGADPAQAPRRWHTESMKASFLLGTAFGYVLGTRAGRKRYEQLAAGARRVASSPAVQSAAGRLSHRVVAQIPVVRTVAERRRAASGKPAAAAAMGLRANGSGAYHSEG
jgi:hypothetical protein